jgi:hypothetical protein
METKLSISSAQRQSSFARSSRSSSLSEWPGWTDHRGRDRAGSYRHLNSTGGAWRLGISPAEGQQPASFVVRDVTVLDELFSQRNDLAPVSFFSRSQHSRDH